MSGRALGNVLNVSRCFSTYRLRQHKELPLHPGHHLLIICVCRTPGITQDGIAETLCLDKTTVAHRVAKLEQTGYVERRPSPEDKRAIQVFPTQKAIDAMPQIVRIFRCWESFVAQDLSEEERCQLASMLENMKARSADWMEKR